MKYSAFQDVMSDIRLDRYLTASGNNSRKAMTLYRKNLKLCQELFTVISCFEIALRNRIDRHYISIHGNDWLRDSVRPDGIFSTVPTKQTHKIINTCLSRLTTYNHSKLVAEMDFGFWRYLFASPQFKTAGQSLLKVFPNKPSSTPTLQYNHTYVFNHLDQINHIRNRIAHHEPICFRPKLPIKDTTYARQRYNVILQFFKWLNIDEAALLYGLDHISPVCDEIDRL